MSSLNRAVTVFVVILTALAVPPALIGVGVRALLTPQFLQHEYHTPGFPPDDYGFSTSERLRWGTYGVDYLLNHEGISYLGNLRLGDGTAVFTERELSHMSDVKRVVQALLTAWYGVIAILVLLCIAAWRGRWLTTYLFGLRAGGVFTLVVAALAALVATIGAAGSGEIFWDFFSGFHGLFFSGDSWLFAYSDTLIRLYPLKFWEDALLYIGVITAFGAAALAFGIPIPSTIARR